MRPALIAQVALSSAVGALLSSFAGLYVADQTLDVRAALVLRAVLVTVVLVATCWFTVRTRVLGATRARLRVGGLAGLALGYALTPTTWDGRTYAAELVTRPGVVAAVVDLVLWLVVGGAAVVVASAQASADEPATYATR